LEELSIDGRIILKWKWGGGVDWIRLVQDRVWWWDFVKRVKDLQDP
jgi:hypothetical protein